VRSKDVEIIMNRSARRLIVALILAVLAVGVPTIAQGDVELREVSWQTVSGTGMVQFHLQWHNPDPLVASLPVAGETWAQSYGAFLPTESLIGTFDIPPIEPESFFDVYFEVPFSSLPAPPTETYSSKPVMEPPGVPCPPGDHWDGNIDILWGGPGGNGHVNYHVAQLMVCPGLGTSYIHMITGCAVASPWVIAGVCAGWNVALLNEDFSAAPNPVPGGWTGWIATTANPAIPVGQQCCFQIVFTCGVQTATVQLCAIACYCPPIGVKESPWGAVKGLYR